MKVELYTVVSGPMGSWQPGIREIPTEFARKLIKSGHARDANKRKVEKAVRKQADETAELEN